MNRQYSRDGLLNEYQKEAKEIRDKKIAERQNRVEEERNLLDQINKKFESEKSEKQNLKLQRINEMKEENNKILWKKQEQAESVRKARKEDYDTVGTFKIGNDKREIKRKSYDEISDALVINPMKNNRGRIEGDRNNNNPIINNVYPSAVRGKSHGFNPINHTAHEGAYYPISNNFEHKNVISNINDQKFNLNNTNSVNQQYIQHNDYNLAEINSNFDNPQQNAMNHLTEVPSSNYQSHYEEKEISQDRMFANNNNNYRINQLQADNNSHINNNNHEINDPDFHKYYQEYIRKRLADEVDKIPNNVNIRSSTPRESHNLHLDSRNQPMSYVNNKNYAKNSDLIIQDQQNENIRNDEIESNNYQNLGNLSANRDPSQNASNSYNNLNSKNNSEYYRNKMTNQEGFGFNHRSIQNQNFANLENELNMNKESYLSKQRMQDNYRHFLDTQVINILIKNNF